MGSPAIDLDGNYGILRSRNVDSVGPKVAQFYRGINNCLTEVKIKAITTTLLSTAVALGGCANTAEYLRSQPVTYFRAEPDIAIPDIPEGLRKIISLHCMKELDPGDTVNGISRKQCLYISADAVKLTNAIDKKDDPEIRDKVIAFLVSLSDMNCSNFLHRAFANKAGLDFTRSFVGDIATGVSVGTAHANPAISAGLGVGNLIIGKGVESFNSAYYFDKTFQALDSAITAERIKVRTLIAAKQARANAKRGSVGYEMVQVLSDLRAYDDACSIKAGLAQLVQLADTKKEAESAKRVTIELSPKPDETALKLYGVQALE